MKTRFTCPVSALAVMASSFAAQASTCLEWDDPAVIQVNAPPRQGVSLLKLEWSAGNPASLPADADFVN